MDVGCVSRGGRAPPQGLPNGQSISSAPSRPPLLARKNPASVAHLRMYGVHPPTWHPVVSSRGALTTQPPTNSPACPQAASGTWIGRGGGGEGGWKRGHRHDLSVRPVADGWRRGRWRRLRRRRAPVVDARMGCHGVDSDGCGRQSGGAAATAQGAATTSATGRQPPGEEGWVG